MSDDFFRVALPLAGGAIGLAFGVPSLGFVAGSLAAQLLFPPDPRQVEQPLITDWKLSQSGLGVDIPFFVAGSDRVPGSLTYHGGVRVVTTTRTEGGKGGPSTEITEHTYFATFAIVGAQINYSIVGSSDPDFPELTTSIRRIWMGGTLIYDASVGNLGAISKYTSNIFLRLGGELQVAHPAIQADVGGNRAPTYRGRPGVDFVNLPLADFSNSAFPAPSMEIVNAPAADVCVAITDAKNLRSQFAFGNTFLIVLGQLDSGLALKKIDLFNNQVVGTRPVPHTGSVESGTIFTIDHEGNIYITEDRDTGDNSSFQYIIKHEFNTLEPIVELEIDPDIEFDHGSLATPALHATSTIFIDPLTGESLTLAIYVLWSRTSVEFSSDFARDLWILDPDTLQIRNKIPTGAPLVEANVTLISDDQGFAYLLDAVGGTGGASREVTLYIFNHLGLSQTIDLRARSTVFADFETAAGMGSGDTWDVDLQGYDESTNGLIIKIADEGPITETWIINISAEDFSLQGKHEYVIDSPSDRLNGIHVENINDGIAWVQFQPSTTLSLQELDLASMETIRFVFAACSSLTLNSVSLAAYDPLSKSFIANEGPSGSDNGIRIYLDRVDNSTGVTMQDAVGVILDSVRPNDSIPRSIGSLINIGLEGYTSRRHTTGRGILEPATRDGAFDLIESDAKIKATVRGAAPFRTLTADDLGAASEGDEVVDVEINRAHSLELPSRVDYKYRTPSRDYNIGVQGADFPEDVVTSRATVTLSSPINWTDQQASDIVHRIVDSSHIGEGRVKLTLFPEFLIFDPGDVIAAPIEGELTAIYIESVTIGANRLVEIEGITDDPKGWSQSTIPASRDDQQFFDGTLFGVQPPVRVILIDVALFRDQDDVFFGPYAAIASFVNGGDGAFLYRSSADGDSLKVGAVNPENYAIVGDTLTVLPATVDLEVLDEISTVDVHLMHSGMSLSSVSELEALNGANAMLIGNEVVIAQTVVDLGNNDWRLSDFRRAERGTDWAVGLHAVAERFVLLTPDTLIRLSMDLGQKDVELFYQAVPIGGSALDAQIQSFTWTGLEKKPLTVVHVESALVSNDKKVDWVGRSRVGGDFLDAADIPTAEETLEYQIDVIDTDTAGTVLNTYTVAAETWTYELADYIADFGLAASETSDVGVVDIVIYQMSATVGRGHPTAVTI